MSVRNLQELCICYNMPVKKRYLKNIQICTSVLHLYVLKHRYEEYECKKYNRC